MICTIYATLAQAQYSVSGTVENEAGEKLEAALVYLMGTEYATTTDEKGFFEIKGIDAGYYKIKSSFLGYENVTRIRYRSRFGMECNYGRHYFRSRSN